MHPFNVCPLSLGSQDLKTYAHMPIIVPHYWYCMYCTALSYMLAQEMPARRSWREDEVFLAIVDESRSSHSFATGVSIKATDAFVVTA